MREITVDKADLLAKLETNRADHRAIFDEALEGFRRRVEEDLERILADTRAGRRNDVRIVHTAPRDHTADYNRAIAMVEMAIGDTITLTEHDFACYVMDDWGWQGEFLSTAYGSRTANTKFADTYTVG